MFGQPHQNLYSEVLLAPQLALEASVSGSDAIRMIVGAIYGPKVELIKAILRRRIHGRDIVVKAVKYSIWQVYPLLYDELPKRRNSKAVDTIE